MIQSPPCLSTSSSLHVSTVNHLVPDPPTASLPSDGEAKYYLYGFPPKPRLGAGPNPRCLGEADVYGGLPQAQGDHSSRGLTSHCCLGRHSRTFPRCILAQPGSPGLASQLLSHVRCPSWSGSSTTLSLVRPAWTPHWGADPSLP